MIEYYTYTPTLKRNRDGRFLQVPKSGPCKKPSSMVKSPEERQSIFETVRSQYINGPEFDINQFIVNSRLKVQQDLSLGIQNPEPLDPLVLRASKGIELWLEGLLKQGKTKITEAEFNAISLEVSRRSLYT